MDEEVVRAALRHYIHYSAAGDEDRASEIYHEDAVVEFPQSGERFEGVENFREWRRIYPAKVELEILRVRGGADLWVAEVRGRYDDGPWNYGPPSMSFAATRCPARRSTSGRHGRLRSGVPGGEPRLPVSQRAASPGSRRRTRAVPYGSAGRVLVRVRSPPPFGLPKRAQPDRKAGHRSTRSSCANRSVAPVLAQLVSDRGWARRPSGYTQNSEVLPERHAARLGGASHQDIEIVGLAQRQHLSPARTPSRGYRGSRHIRHIRHSGGPSRAG